MFWSGNYIAVRELNFLLKEEDVSLTQVLEADDILQECKADNKALIQFLTKPEVLAELITLITEEPPKNVELRLQYRHASIACEVLTSHLSTLADRLSLDTVQMNRLCDFINREPPLNPLLASYFSKTVEMLLERSPKQDWYLYHIVCLRVLDFFRSRRDFLPNLLRHMATSAIADTFKCLLRLDDLFNKIVMEWLDEHQFLESLIQIICGSYVPEPIRPHSAAPSAPSDVPGGTDGVSETEKAADELSEKSEVNHKDACTEEKLVENSAPPPVESKTAPLNEHSDLNKPSGGKRNHDDNEAHMEEALSATRTPAAEERWRAVAAANAAALLCDLILNGCAGEGCTTRLRTVWVLVSRLQSEEWVRALLAGMFTSPPPARQRAVVHGCQLLLALLCTEPILAGQCAAERTSVELAVAPHLPLLHQALLQTHTSYSTAHNYTEHDGGGGAENPGAVGAARVHVAALLAQLALSEVQDVPSTMITLGTPGTLVDLFFRYPDNNFLHAQVYALIKHALANRAYCTQYATHLLIECDLLTRLMDVFEENENKRAGIPRAGYMGHVTLALRRIARALEEQDSALQEQLRLPDALLARWTAFSTRLAQVAQQLDTPLGGYYPSENIYEVDHMTELADSIEASYEFNDMSGNTLDEQGDDGNIDTAHEFGEAAEDGDGQSDSKTSNAYKSFLKIINQREKFGDDMWDDTPEGEAVGEAGAGGVVGVHDVQDVLAAVAPWETSTSDSGSTNADDDWAQFSAAPAPPPIDPFAPLQNPALPPQDFTPFWPNTDDTNDIPDDIMRLSKFSISATFPDQIEPETMSNTNNAESRHVNVDSYETKDITIDNSQNALFEPFSEVKASVNTNKLDVDNDNAVKINTDNVNAGNVNVKTRNVNVNTDNVNVNTDNVNVNTDNVNVNTSNVNTNTGNVNVNTDSVNLNADSVKVNSDNVNVNTDSVAKTDSDNSETTIDVTEPTDHSDS